MRRKLDRAAPLSVLTAAPFEALLTGHRMRMGRVDGRIRLWDTLPPPAAPLYQDEVYLAAYAFEAGARPALSGRAGRRSRPARARGSR